MLFGREMRGPQDVSLIPKQNLGTNHKSHLSDLLQDLEVTRTIAAENTTRAKEIQAQQYNRAAKEPDFSPGQRVWLFCQKVEKGHSSKLTKKWLGPYYIVHLGPNFTYKLRRCSDDKLHKPLVHANRLKHYFDPSDRHVYPQLLEQDINPDVIDNHAQLDSLPQQQNVQQPSKVQQPTNVKRQAQSPTSVHQPIKTNKGKNKSTTKGKSNVKTPQVQNPSTVKNQQTSIKQASQPNIPNTPNKSKPQKCNQTGKLKQDKSSNTTSQTSGHSSTTARPTPTTNSRSDLTHDSVPIFKVDEIDSLVTSRRGNGKLYYKVKWKDTIKGTTWEYDTSIPEVLRREFHVKKNMSGKTRKKPLKKHKFPYKTYT
jgi:cell division septation protein DedD